MGRSAPILCPGVNLKNFIGGFMSPIMLRIVESASLSITELLGSTSVSSQASVEGRLDMENDLQLTNLFEKMSFNASMLGYSSVGMLFDDGTCS
jgi:hypothetical protein